MKKTITNINIRYQDGEIDKIDVHFEYRTENYSISTNGYITITQEEFEGKTLNELNDLILTKYIKLLTVEQDENEEETENPEVE